MAMNAETILVYAVDIVILPNIDTVTVVVGIGAPHEIVPPKELIPSIIPGEKSPGTDHCRRK